jgi:hypothetical protein
MDDVTTPPEPVAGRQDMGAPAAPSGSRASHGTADGVSTLPGFDPSRCRNCAGEQWVCENHQDRPWNETEEGCECGAGAPCPVCKPEMANAGLIGEVARWQRLTAGLVSQFDFAGCTCTFQDDDCCSYAKANAAIATETRRAETTGSVEDEGAGPQDIAQKPEGS